MSQTRGTVWWTELMTGDVEAARDYYARVCGWTFSSMPMGGAAYWIASAHGRQIAGMMDMPEDAGDGAAAHWLSYFAVDDLDAALEQGGRVLRAPFDVPDIGRIAIVEDPTGARFGLIVPFAEWEPPETDNGSLENVPV